MEFQLKRRGSMVVLNPSFCGYCNRASAFAIPVPAVGLGNPPSTHPSERKTPRLSKATFALWRRLEKGRVLSSSLRWAHVATTNYTL
jgi:hypothetical protein